MSTSIKPNQLVWITDPHVNFASHFALANFIDTVNRAEPLAVVITGDIAESGNVSDAMFLFDEAMSCPVYFVLGNHDIYDSSVGYMKEQMKKLFGSNGKSKKTLWIPGYDDNDGVVEVAPGVGLIGHDGWYDGRYSSVHNSKLKMSDFHTVSEMAHCYDYTQLAACLAELAYESAEYTLRTLPVAFEKFNTVFFITHVPAWPENAVYQGKVSDQHWLPYFSNRHLGDSLLKVMSKQPSNKKLIVLQGHSHGYAYHQPLHNIHSYTGFAQYKHPSICGTFGLHNAGIDAHLIQNAVKR